MKELVWLVGGALLTWAGQGAWELYFAPRWRAWRRRRSEGPQWFKPSDGPQADTPAARLPQPGTRPIVGQRPAQGSHRAKQRQVRFASRSFRQRRDRG